MNLKWCQLKEYLESLSDEALKCDILISNPSDKLHVCSGVRTASKNDIFSKGTLYLSAGKKRYKYWIAEKPLIRVVYLGRGTDVVEEYRVIKIEKDIWVDELKDWKNISPFVRGIFRQEVHLEEIDEKTVDQFLDLVGTSW